jgi:diguanylate cyclase (GGDEF)-like protein/PAS domain S-box-containing protein
MSKAAATILIVDDEAANRKLLEVLLRPEGYVTLTAASGAEALACVAQHPPDLILLDVMMPGMDGFQVARSLKDDPATSSIPVVMLTASVDRTTRIAGLKAGAEDFLLKPVDRDELWLRVRNLLRLKAYGDLLQNQGQILEQLVVERTRSLQDSESRFRQMADAIADVFFLQNSNSSKMLYVSPGFERIWGHTCQSLEENPALWAESIHPDDFNSIFTQANTDSSNGFDCEYRIVRPDGGVRWVHVRAFPVLNDVGIANRIAGVASDITHRKLVAQELRESERRFSDLLKNVQLASVMLDREARVTFCNDYLLRITDRKREEVIGCNWFDMFIPHQKMDDSKNYFSRLLDSTPDTWLRENEILTRSHERRLMSWSNSLLRSGVGEVVGSASIGADITEQHQAEVSIKRLNRVYAVLSGINALIVRAANRTDLFREACLIATKEGGFVMSMIALVNPVTMKIVPVASAGVGEDLLAAIKAILSSKEGASITMVARAIATKTTIVSNDSQNDLQILFSKRYAEAGVRSMAVLPLLVAEEAAGVLVFYSDEQNFFLEDELKLLTELAADVAFAIDHIDKQERLDFLAYYDALTGLPNRTLFQETLKRVLATAMANAWPVAVMCIDLDHFKNVNDTLGHAIGDDLLRQFAARLVQCVSTHDTVGRLSGDEFAVVLLMPEGKDAAVLAANRIRDVLRDPFDLGGHQITVTTSIGLSLHPDDASDTATLMQYGDTAMYQAKQAGRDTFRFFTAQMNAEVVARLELETALRKAVTNNEFVLHYQPKVQLSSGRIDGFEALLRWQRPGYGLVGPHDFIRALEETGLIVRVGSWVVSAVCRQMALWMDSPIGAVQISVNVSGRQFIEGDLEGDVIQALGENHIGADQLELELTESSLMANTERTVEILQNLRKRGVQISIDDFGTGYSSLAYLRRFPIDKLKIDIAFVRDVTTNPDAASIVLAIIRMAHSLKMEVIAEGVETAAQLAYLRRHHCDLIQGYCFSPPVELPEAEEMLRAAKHLSPMDGPDSLPSNTLLLVDDEPDVLTALKRALHFDGYNILLAHSAAEGFEVLALNSVQVILCDQLMPGMSGTDFLDRVKDMYPETLRIVLSGYSDLRPIVDAINRGAVYRFYTKPWDNKELRDNVRAAFRHYWLLRGDFEDLATATSSHESHSRP